MHLPFVYLHKTFLYNSSELLQLPSNLLKSSLPITSQHSTARTIASSCCSSMFRHTYFLYYLMLKSSPGIFTYFHLCSWVLSRISSKYDNHLFLRSFQYKAKTCYTYPPHSIILVSFHTNTAEVEARNIMSVFLRDSSPPRWHPSSYFVFRLWISRNNEFL